MNKLTDKAVVVTGAGQGIGAAYVADLLSHGAFVIVNDLSRDLVQSQLDKHSDKSSRIKGISGDVADPECAERIIQTCVESFGKIDGLINNAGVMFVGPSTDSDPTRVRKLIEVNVLGSIYCGIEALKVMLHQGFGSIVNVTSGAHMGLPNTAIYGASKGAVASLTYDWASDVSGTGVRVNAISPMAATQMASDVFKQRKMDDASIQEALRAFPQPEINAPVASYLISDASQHLNGQIVRIDGDQLSLVSRPSVIRPSVREEAWNLENVTEAFEQTLSALSMPEGILELTGEYRFGPVSNYRI